MICMYCVFKIALLVVWLENKHTHLLLVSVHEVDANNPITDFTGLPIHLEPIFLSY